MVPLEAVKELAPLRLVREMVSHFTKSGPAGDELHLRGEKSVSLKRTD